MNSAIRLTNVSQANACHQVRRSVVPVANLVTSSSTIHPHKPCGPYSLLLAELPDLFQDLFLQFYDSFAYFPRLPVEIRLSIWRFSFPRGRLINLDRYIGSPFIWDSERVRASYIEANCALPSTLHVNQESRTQTLKNYSVVLRTKNTVNGLNLRPHPRPLCYNPRLDTMFFTDSYFLHLKRLKWLQRLQTASLATFSSIEELEIRDWHWREALDWELTCALKSGKLSDELTFFLRFPGLRSLKIILSLGATKDLTYKGPYEHIKEELVQRMEKFFQRFGHKGTTVPKVTVEPWRRLMSRVA